MRFVVSEALGEAPQSGLCGTLRRHLQRRFSPVELPAIKITKRREDFFSASIPRGKTLTATSLADIMKIAEDFLAKASVPKPPADAGPVGYAIKKLRPAEPAVEPDKPKKKKFKSDYGSSQD